MWEEIIEYLKDPHLVAKIQKKFGVEIHYNGKLETKKRKVERKTSDSSARLRDKKRNGINMTKTDINGYLTTETWSNELSSSDREIVTSILKNKKSPSSSDEEITSTSDSEPREFTIKNHFWYYLFLFGTELGDEIFYSSFIPFWFWNIDGAVGRRVVLVWAIVMTIGKIKCHRTCRFIIIVIYYLKK